MSNRPKNPKYARNKTSWSSAAVAAARPVFSSNPPSCRCTVPMWLLTRNGASNRMVKLLWGPVLILLRTALQSDPAIPEGLDREAASAQKSFSQTKECLQIPAHSPRSIQPRTVCSGATSKPAPTLRLCPSCSNW